MGEKPRSSGYRVKEGVVTTMKNADIAKAMTIKLGIPQWTSSEETFPGSIRRAPDRGFRLSPAQTELALKNACATFLKNIMMNLSQSSSKN